MDKQKKNLYQDNSVRKLEIIKPNEIKQFMESYDKLSISKHFDSFLENKVSLIESKIISINQIQELGRIFAIKENNLIIKSIFNSEFIVKKQIKLEDLQNFILKNDPHKIYMFFTNYTVRKILMKKGFLNFDQDLKKHTFLSRELIAIENSLLENKILFICNEITYLGGIDIKFIKKDEYLKAKRKIKVFFSDAKIWLLGIKEISG